jgi:hypothetical protein
MRLTAWALDPARGGPPHGKEMSVKRPWRVGLLAAVLGGISLVAAACSGGGSPTPVGAAMTGDRGAVLFFINPAGRPCQMQRDILESARREIEERASIVYVSTERAEDRAAFHRFGIRALPAIVVLGADGSEAERLPPGVQPAERVLAATRRL